MFIPVLIIVMARVRSTRLCNVKLSEDEGKRKGREGK
jgi:hypothetical protein